MGKTYKHDIWRDDEDSRHSKKSKRRDINRRKEKHVKNQLRAGSFDVNIFDDDDYMEK